MELDPVLIGLVIGLGSPFLVFMSALATTWMTRKSNREANDIARFNSITATLERRLKEAEDRIDQLEAADKKKMKVMVAQRRYISKLLRIITSHIPELAADLFAPDPRDAPFITGVLGDTDDLDDLE